MDNNPEESSPLLGNPPSANDEKKASRPAAAPPPPPPPRHGASAIGWAADGVPLGHGSVVGEPVRRAQWNTGLFACLGSNDEFCGSDLEVCLLGSLAPCVLYGSNIERLGSVPGTFTAHCLPYSGLYLIGNSVFGWNCLAPWFSYPSRTAIRRRFNLEGSCESLHRSCGCYDSVMEDEVHCEQRETTCDFVTHVFCHTCALCQEGREIRRKLTHPGFNAQPVLVMIPPGQQTMTHDGAK